MKRLLALVLALTMLLGVAAVAEPAAEPVYTYNDSVSTMATNWNQHTYKTADDGYPIDFIASGLYTFIFNDELHPIEGMDPYTGYVIVPEMAAEMPVDVTEEVKAAYPKFGIPADATSGYAYKIALNPDAKWDDGTPITADTYVESMERLLRPELLNYRATDYAAMSNSFVIANAEAYHNSNMTVKLENGAGGENEYVMKDLAKNADGVYCTAEGGKVYIALDVALEWCSGNTLKDYVDAYGASYFGMDTWEGLIAQVDDDGYVELTDDTLAAFIPVIASNPAWNETEENVPCYLYYDKTYPEASFDNVGIMKTGDYEITIVLAKSLKGFYLNYALNGNWIVKTDLYDACLSESNGVWTNTYNTSLETSASYGPYKITSYQTDKQMVFEKNENWYGWNDGKHVFVDPVDGETYPMYQTDRIVCDVVAESTTRKQMFLNGQLITYGLQNEDMETYRSSEYCYASPGSTLFFMILNGYISMLNERENAADFDKTTTDLQTMTVQNFRKALAVSYDRDDFCAVCSPARSGGFGIIGRSYIADPELGTQYRDTEAAQKALCEFYSVDTTKFASLKEAADSITGYDPVAAKELFTLAYAEAIEAGYITDEDGDGKSDQTVTLTYALSADNDFQTTMINYLNDAANKAAEGTPFEGKIAFVKSAPLGNDWSDSIRNGQSDVVLGGWNGSLLDPYGVITLYTNPEQAYDSNWFNAQSVKHTMTLNLDGVDTTITATLYDWAECLNGTAMEVDGKTYNFGAYQVPMETRLEILASLEGVVLNTYNYLPMIQDGGMSLLSQKVFYVVEDYNAVLGRGGITYLRYNYSDAEWDAYVAECGGTLTY